MTPTSNQVVIYDLDGTLVPFNSYKRWLVFTVVSALFFLNWDYCWLIVKTTIKRICCKPHRRCGLDPQSPNNEKRVIFKQTIVAFHEQKAHRRFVKWCNFRFAVYLKKKTRKELLEAGKDLYLATAAPDCYVKHYAQLMNCFRDYSATCFEKGVMHENIGANKLTAVSQQLGNNITHATLYTDHEDDLPLAYNVSVVFLVNPTERTKQVFISAGISFIIKSY